MSRTNVDQLVETIARRVEAEIERQLGREPQPSDLAPCATCKVGVHCEPKRVVGAVNAGAKRIGVEGLLEAAPCGHLAPLIDHTILKPEATKEELRKVCDEARRFGFATVCVNSANVRFVAACLEGSGVKAIAVVGFPLGAATPSAKAFETREAIRNGAQEIDMVINIGALKSRDLAEAFADIKAVVEAAGRVPVKVILETSKLDHDEKVMACTLSKAAGAAFVKTSTGFGGGGATPEDVALMRKVVGDDIGVKASGGIRTTEDAEKVLAAGASRIGASSSVEIVRCAKPDPKAKAAPKGY